MLFAPIRRPLLAFLIPQFVACVAVAMWRWWGFTGLSSLAVEQPRTAILIAAIAQASTAALTAMALRTPRWWWFIHLGFAPLAVLLLAQNVPPVLYLVAFVVTLLVFGRVDRTQVPLYLTNAATATVIEELLPTNVRTVVDLGCGSGGVLKYLARRRSACQFVGIEHAPLTWIWASLNCARTPNVAIRYGRWETVDLGTFDVVYAFLSPAAMPHLWMQASQQLHPRSLLISNSFEVPGVSPTSVAHVSDGRNTRLYLYGSAPPTGAV